MLVLVPAFLAGGFVGHVATEHQVETKVEQAPPKVVTKYKTHTVYKTRTVRTPLDPTCKALIRSTKQVGTKAGSLFDMTDEMLDILEDARVAVLSDDQQRLGGVDQRVIDLQNNKMDRFIDLEDEMTAYTQLVKDCKQ